LSIKIWGQERAVSLHNGNFYRHGGRGVELSLSSSRKTILKRGKGIPLATKYHFLLGIGLSFYKSIGHYV
jgi:hypothetical protein